ncbi:hypothetical protein MMC20_007940 [Loxospora ochrophaea]|nr:hypothetical protein [Loxospora ochrophaea]
MQFLSVILPFLLYIQTAIAIPVIVEEPGQSLANPLTERATDCNAPPGCPITFTYCQYYSAIGNECSGTCKSYTGLNTCFVPPFTVGCVKAATSPYIIFDSDKGCQKEIATYSQSKTTSDGGVVTGGANSIGVDNTAGYGFAA